MSPSLAPNGDHPHSSETERAILGAVLLAPEILDDLALSTKDFYLERHQVIFQAFCELGADGHPIDLRTLQAYLERQAQLEAVGGLAYLTSLDLDLPDIGRADVYAGILRERTRRRELLALARRLERRVLASDSEAEALLSLTARELDQIELPAAGSEETLTSRVLADVWERREQHLRTRKPVMGLATGIPRLDSLLGGLERGFDLLAGGPGVGKTTLALQIALHVARHEAPVIFISFETSARSLLLKALCSRAGLNPRDFRRGFGDPAVLEQAAKELEPALARLHLQDGSGHLTIGQLRSLARRQLREHRASRCLLIVDYLQLWAKASRELRHLDTGRSKVDTLAGDLIELSKAIDSPILALSSQSRVGGNYGKGGGESSLDSFKESGDLEYSADVAMFLTENRERPVASPLVAVDLTVRKHREGPLGVVELIFHPERGTLREEASRC